MTSNRRVSFGLIADILDALEQHGHLRGDDQHAGRAIGLIGDLARIWEGTQDYPAGAHLIKIPSSAPGSGAVTLAGEDSDPLADASPGCPLSGSLQQL